MFDKREAILARMMALLGSVNSTTPPLNVFRNRAEIPTDKLPALILLDGKENLKYPDMPKTRGGILVASAFELRPQVFIVLRPRDTIENVGVGEELSALRMQVLQAFRNDWQSGDLGVLLGSNGDLLYDGHDTDLQTGSTVLGQMQMHFVLSYVLNPNDLN